jgi:Putative esterase
MPRRCLLLGGLGGSLAGVAAGAGMITDALPGGPFLRRTIGMTGPDGIIADVPPAPVTIRRVRSASRSRDVDLVDVRPGGAGPAVPVCLALHGRGGSARSLLDLGIPWFLTAAIGAGVPPFAIAMVDCGDTYLMPRGDDHPLMMLTEELPAWLGAPPAAAIGISMGGFGALCLARRLPLRAVAVAGPALFRNWPDADSRHAFTSQGQWADHEPLRHTGELAGLPLGVWCGTEDPFIDAAKELIAKTQPQHSAVTRGAHNDGYWRRVLPDMLRFIGSRITT